jgi:polar amino acid transport system substrate-binding protein
MGKYTAIVGAVVADAPDFVFPPIPQGMAEDAFYVRKDSNWHYEDLTSLENISLAVVSGYAYSETIDAYIKSNRDNFKRIQIMSGEEALALNIKKLLAGRVDVLIDNDNVMAFTLKQKKLTKEVKLVYTFPTDDQSFLYIALSPSHPKAEQYAKILSDETKAMRTDGTLQKIMANYGLTVFREKE